MHFTVKIIVNQRKQGKIEWLTNYVKYAKICKIKMQYGIKNKESEKMLELEENIRLLEELKSKLQNLGESLWHCQIRRRT